MKPVRMLSLKQRELPEKPCPLLITIGELAVQVSVRMALTLLASEDDSGSAPFDGRSPQAEAASAVKMQRDAKRPVRVS